SPAAVLDDRLVGAQIEGGNDGPRAVGRRQRKRLPAARAQPQGGVLELGLRRGKLHRELSEHLRMRVERVAGRAPRVVGERWPPVGHGFNATTPVRPLRTRSGLKKRLNEVGEL